ncbi:B-cell receptor CD22-like isoform X2 [Acanthochromis polyacanthus]|nr:B-cell receptor CD22-like isoform X2 [Acanthochromis polyacanthus]
MRMFALIWTTALLFVTGTPAENQHCVNGHCVTLTEGELAAEVGLCVVIPCSFTTASDFTIRAIVWYKCETTKKTCGDSDMIFHSNNKNNKNLQARFQGRVLLLEPDLRRNVCSIIINDLWESDSGSYELRVKGLLNGTAEEILFYPRATVSVKGLTQKPSVMIPALKEGKQAILTCTAPGLCSGSRPKISWTWTEAGGKESDIPRSIISFRTEHLTAVTKRHRSTLNFSPSAEHHGTKITCKVSFKSGTTTEKTLTLNVNYVKKVQISGNRSLKKGETLNLTCSVESFPPSFVAWTKRNCMGSLIRNQRSSTLVIPDVRAEHSGQYVCEAMYMERPLLSYVNITVGLDLAINCGSCRPVLPWVVAGVSLSVNVLVIILISCLWNSRKKVKPNQEDRTYMSLQRTDTSPEYEVIAQR